MFYRRHGLMVAGGLGEGMQRHVILLWLIFMAGCVGFAQSSSPSPGQNAGSTPAVQTSPSRVPQSSGDQHVVPIELTKSLDAKKLKPGDPVMAKTTGILQFGNGMMVPIGSRVQGHITQAAVRSKGGEQSSLGIAFDTISFKEGQVPVKTTIQAVAAPPEWPLGSPSNGNRGVSQPPIMGPGTPTNPSGTPYPGGAGNPTGGYPQTPSSYPQHPSGQPDTADSPVLGPKSEGVVGMRNVTLQPNSILMSTDKDLKLEAGTEMILRVQDQ
jgi:hypothetical protein